MVNCSVTFSYFKLITISFKGPFIYYVITDGGRGGMPNDDEMITDYQVEGGRGRCMPNDYEY